MCGIVIYSVVFPVVLHRFRAAPALMWLVLLQIALSFIFVYVYDRAGRDIFNIPQLKQKFWEKFKWREDHAGERSFLERAGIFAFYAWKVTPPMVLLLMRKGERRGHPLTEIGIVLLAITTNTLYSFAIAIGYGLLKTAFLILVALLAVFLVFRFVINRRKATASSSVLRPLSRL